MVVFIGTGWNGFKLWPQVCIHAVVVGVKFGQV